MPSNAANARRRKSSQNSDDNSAILKYYTSDSTGLQLGPTAVLYEFAGLSTCQNPQSWGLFLVQPLATITTIIKVASIGKLVPEDFSTHTQTKSCQKGSKPARTCLSKSKRSWQVLSGFGSFWPDLAGFLPKPLFGRIGKDGP